MPDSKDEFLELCGFARETGERFEKGLDDFVEAFFREAPPDRYADLSPQDQAKVRDEARRAWIKDRPGTTPKEVLRKFATIASQETLAQYTQSIQDEFLDHFSRHERARARFDEYYEIQKSSSSGVLRKLPGGADHDDALQNIHLHFTQNDYATLLKYFPHKEKREQKNGDGSFAPWFRQVAYNKARDLGRAERTRNEHEKKAEAGSPPRTPAASLRAKEIGAAFRECLQEMNVRYKLAVICRFQDGWKTRDIAQILNISQNQAVHLVSHAKHQLRQCLSDKGFRHE